MKDEYKTICDKCGRKTWYEEEQQCHCTYTKVKVCPECKHAEEVYPLKMVRCTGTLKKINYSNLNSDFTPYYNNGQRIEVDFGYEKKRGTIGMTTGWKPAYLLMLTTRSKGSSYLIDKESKIVKVI